MNVLTIFFQSEDNSTPPPVGSGSAATDILSESGDVNPSSKVTTQDPSDALYAADALQVATQTYPWLYMSSMLDACFTEAERSAKVIFTKILLPPDQHTLERTWYSRNSSLPGRSSFYRWEIAIRKSTVDWVLWWAQFQYCTFPLASLTQLASDIIVSAVC